MNLDMTEMDLLQRVPTRDCGPVAMDRQPRRRIDDDKPEISSKWGGARPNSGGPRENSGGARPGAGRKPNPIVIPSFASDVPRWCVVMFRSQAEISGARELTRQGYDAYMPMTAIRRRDRVISTMFHVVRVPMLPGYGFIQMTQSASREPIEATRGVRGMLRRPDGRLAYAQDAEIALLLLGEADRLELPKEHGSVLDVGTRVRVEEGPFAPFPGTVIECDGVKTRVEIEIFGRLTPTWLDRVSLVTI